MRNTLSELYIVPQIMAGASPNNFPQKMAEWKSLLYYKAMSNIFLCYAGGKNHWEPTVLMEQKFGKIKETLHQIKEQPDAKE